MDEELHTDFNGNIKVIEQKLKDLLGLDLNS